MNKLYILPFLFLFVGGIIMYALQKDKNNQLAKRGLYFGIVWSVVAIIVLPILFPLGLYNVNTSLNDLTELTKNQKIVVEMMESACYDLYFKLDTHSETLAQTQYDVCIEKIQNKINQFTNSTNIEN